MTKYEAYKAERTARGLYCVAESTWNAMMGIHPYTPDERIVEYLYALLHDSTYISGSWGYLRKAYAAYGSVTVDALLLEHWDVVREQLKSISN